MLSAFLPIFCLMSSALQAAPALSEYQLKAVFLYNFAKFATWPTNTQESERFNLCVIGDDPFGAQLDLTVEQQQINNVPIAVLRLQKLEDIPLCRILYISRSEEKRLTQIIDVTAQSPVLTVSDIEGAAYAGVIIEFMEVARRIRLVINVDSAQRAGIMMRANLLKMATTIKAGDTGINK